MGALLGVWSSSKNLATSQASQLMPIKSSTTLETMSCMGWI